VAIYEQKTTGSAMHYVYTDYLGSLRCITDSSGNVEQRLSFDAWGNRRDPITGVKPDSTGVAGVVTVRGFTGHEHLDEFGLINMNGRVYDPMLGMFISPDNFVQAPDFTQNFNRYAYCLNNPLMYTDPTGEAFGIDDAIIISAFAYYGGMQANFFHCAENNIDPFNPGNWNWSSFNTYYGIAAGALQGYSYTMEHCEYLIDINTKEKLWYSDIGDGKFDILHFGQWNNKHTAFELFNTIVEDVPFGGVDNTRNIATANSIANIIWNTPRVKDDDKSAGGESAFSKIWKGDWSPFWNQINAVADMTTNQILEAISAAGPAGLSVGPVGIANAGATEAKWVYGAFKSEAKWAGQLSKRGWTPEQITEAITKGKSFDAVNMVNKANPAIRYVHPTTGQSVVIDKITNELLHVGGPGFKY
jgi:RHS repeat-associated protein